MIKKLISLILCAIFLVTVCLFSFSTYAAGDEPGGEMLDQIIIKFFDRSSFPGKEKQYDDEVTKIRKDGLSIVSDNVYVVKADGLSKNLNAILNKYKNSEFIVYVEPNYIGAFDATPNDPNYSALKALLTAINAQNGWDIIKSGGPAVAIVDSGIYQHPDLPKLLPGYSAVANLSPNNDMVGHGTGVAGTLGALGNNGTGTVGINWNANILPVKVDDATGTLSVANIAKGIIWAADNGAKILSLSVSTTSDSVTLKNAIDYAYSKGCAIFASTGNDGKNTLNYPARYANVMAVGATSNGTARASISNYGSGLGVVAISSYTTTTATGGYASMGGTSFSTPQVSGLATLMLALNPTLTNDQVYSYIQQGAKPLGGGYNEQTGYGLIDIGKTLQLISAHNQPAIIETPPAPVLTLWGSLVMEIDQGADFNEPGYSAADYLGTDLSGAVSVTNNVNIWTPGLYTVTYNVEDAAGQTACATRSVMVSEREIELPPVGTPVITIIGSDPIILHLGSATPYSEQGALAYDDVEGDLSANVQIIGEPNREAAGTYTITYTVTNSAGQQASATRNVLILAAEEIVERTPYNFSGQGKAPTTTTHSGVIVEQAGWMDLKATAVDNKSAITVNIINMDNNETIYSNRFTAIGATQFWADEGRYKVTVTINEGNGNCKYSISLLTPEKIFFNFSEEEVPYDEWNALLTTTPQTDQAGLPWQIPLLLAASLLGLKAVCRSLKRK